MEDQSQNKVDMSLDDIIKLNRKEKRLTQKANGALIRGRGQGRGRGQLRGMGRGMQGKVTGKGQKQQRAFLRQGRGRGRVNSSLSSQNINRASMRGVNQAVVSRRGRGRGRGRGIAQQNQTGGNRLKRQPSPQNVKNLRGIGRGRGKMGVLSNKKNQLIFTNSSRRQQRSQQLSNVKAQATLIREKEAALKNLQQAKRNMQSINQAIHQTARDNVVNQRRGLNTNDMQMGRGRGRGRGRGKLLAGLMKKTISTSNLSSTSSRQMTNTSVTISNPLAAKRRRQWRSQKSNVVLQVDNRSRATTASKPSFLDQLKNLKPAEPTTYKFQKNMFAVPSTSLSLNDRFSGQTTVDNSGDGRKVFV